MKKENTSEKLPTLADEDIVTIGRDKAQQIVRSGKNVTVSLALVMTGASHGFPIPLRAINGLFRSIIFFQVHLPSKPSHNFEPSFRSTSTQHLEPNT